MLESCSRILNYQELGEINFLSLKAIKPMIFCYGSLNRLRQDFKILEASTLQSELCEVT